MQKLKAEIIDFCEKRGLVAGFTDASDFDGLKEVLEKTRVPFVSAEASQRISPSLCLKNAKSIICLLMGYNKAIPDMNIKRLCKEKRGYISIAAVGEDYHIKLKRELDEICREILKPYGSEGVSFCDTGPLVDRELAVRAGLGYYGRSGAFINERLGSMCFIGYIITDADIPKDMPENGSCKNCGLCIKACPTGALSENGFDYEKCISYLTQKRELTGKEKEMIGISLYGCDKCQLACFYNRGKEKEEARLEEVYPLLDDILSLTNSSFKKTYGNTAAGWRGKNALKRNAGIVLENIRKYEVENGLLE